MNKPLIAFIWPLLLMAMAPSAQAWLATNATNQCFKNGTLVPNGSTWWNGDSQWTCDAGAGGAGFPILVRNGGGPASYNGTIAVGSSGACDSGANGCGSGSNPNQYMTMAQAGPNLGQLCAGSGVPSDGSIVYAFGATSSYGTTVGLWAFVYDSSGTAIWSGALQGDPKNGHNGDKGTVNTNSNGQLQGTWCGANSYNP